MRIIFQSLLAIVVTFVYVAGSYMTVEMEHSHGVCESHGHEHAGNGHEHSHNHAPAPSSETPDKDEPNGESHSHTHLVSLGADISLHPTLHKTFMTPMHGTNHPEAISESAPDGPCFPLIKPPQLG